ncbi:DEAD/DEAH box helicase [Brochothrix thermosphacta]|uniref:DEAD/DEAH box helicase n=1 Tax=Brochothrix thermosphacta TaxID=2756 RepID=UPI00083FA77F|nr:helicase-related protein [Brochothrix thermosphacta]MDO7864712.1 helicase-related protein [Brochothrix thermosphacta]ODJ57787.1 hypothetical protein BFR44_09995 [Brochothrix thermosphacta]
MKSKGQLHLVPINCEVLEGWQTFPTFEKEQCWRCGSDTNKEIIQVTHGVSEPYYYCRSCLAVGSANTCQKYIWQPPLQRKGTDVNLLEWEGCLTPEQSVISNHLKEAVEKGCERYFIWAVTGAGKTEILYETIAFFLQNGGQVAFISPRRAACIDVSKRLKKVFSRTQQVTLHQTSEAVYKDEQLVIATAPQMWRFYCAFDLIIIDEVDAFPYVSSLQLQYGTKRALKKTGSSVLLSATPTKTQKQEMRTGILPYAHLNKRYHGYALVVPRLRLDVQGAKCLMRGIIPDKLKKWLLKHEKRHVLIFVPEISWISSLVTMLKETVDINVAGVSAEDKEREQKIEAFRTRKLRLLVTTTILERGVNFTDIDVVIMNAHHRLYNLAVLIQIAGRVGRSKKFPTGAVICFHAGKTAALNNMIKEIKKHNHEAASDG